MSNHLLGSLKFSGGILSLYCLSLAIVPTAHAQTNVSNSSGTNVSNASGFSIGSNASGFGINNFNSFSQPDTSIGGSGSGDKANDSNTANARAVINQAKAFQSNLDQAQAEFNAASSAYNAALSQSSSSTPPTSGGSAPEARRFTVKDGGVKGEELANCGCANPDVVTTPTTPSQPENSAALAAARARKEKAAAELAQAQTQARQFLAEVKKAPQVSVQNNGFSPLW